jgi:small subunit ribosomal protein S19
MAKEISFRGKTIDELKAMSVREFAQLVPSRERRSILRQFQDIEKFVSRCKKKLGNKKSIKTHKKNIIIVPQLLDMTIHVHNGKEFTPVQINWEMLGHRLGEFTLTRQKVKHGAAGIGATRSSASRAVK